MVSSAVDRQSAGVALNTLSPLLSVSWRPASALTEHVLVSFFRFAIFFFAVIQGRGEKIVAPSFCLFNLLSYSPTGLLNKQKLGEEREGVVSGCVVVRVV